MRLTLLCRRGVSGAAFLALLLGGCAVGPDFHPPAPPDAPGYTAEKLTRTVSADVYGGDAQHFVEDMDVPAEWYRLFHSDALNTLIEQSLKANPDVKAAQAALRGALATVEEQQAALFPTVQASFMPQRFKDAAEVSPTLVQQQRFLNLYTAQLAVSYPLDIFGVTRRSIESARAQADSQRYQLESTYLTLTSNVVAAALQEAALRAQIAATEDIVSAETDALALLRRQFTLGQAAGGDVALQEAALAQAQTALPPLHKQLAQQRDLITALAGRFPNDQPEARFQLKDLTLPTELPVTLPAKLVEHRPDIRMAEAELHAASADVGVAISNILPNLTLSASNGTSATQLGALFMPGNGFFVLGGNLSQTLFDGGALLAKIRAANAALDQAMAQYQSTVLTACQSVADALQALQADADALQVGVASEQAARHSLDIARRQLQLGAVSTLVVLNAEQAYQQAVITRVQAQGNRFADTAVLFQALGGGWMNRDDAAGPIDTGSPHDLLELARSLRQ